MIPVLSDRTNNFGCWSICTELPIVRQSQGTLKLNDLPEPVGPVLELPGCDTLTAAQTNSQQSHAHSENIIGCILNNGVDAHEVIIKGSLHTFVVEPELVQISHLTADERVASASQETSA